MITNEDDEFVAISEVWDGVNFKEPPAAKKVLVVSEVDDLDQVIGKHIRSARYARHLTLEQVARELNMTPGHISMVENGKREPSLKVFLKLCRLLQCSPNDLMDGCF